MHKENFEEIVRQRGMRSVEVEWVGTGCCMVVDSRVPRSWFRSAPCPGCVSPQLSQRLLSEYPDRFSPSIRAAMLLILIVGGGLGWFRARVVRDTVAAISRVGGHAYYASEWGDQADRPIDLPGSPEPNPGWFTRHLGPEFTDSVVRV